MYYEMLLNKWDAKIKKILEHDLFNHIEIVDEKAYKRLTSEFPCQIDSIILVILSLLFLIKLWNLFHFILV